jgi:hypothetical protein
MTASSAVSAGDTVLATHYNNLRLDTLNHKSARVDDTGNQDIPNATATIVTFNRETWDDDSYHSTSTNPSRLTVATAGKYLVTARGIWEAHATGFRQLSLFVNGSLVNTVKLMDAVDNTAPTMDVTAMLKLTASQYVEVKVEQNSGGLLNWTEQSFEIVRLTTE